MLHATDIKGKHGLAAAQGGRILLLLLTLRPVMSISRNEKAPPSMFQFGQVQIIKLSECICRHDLLSPSGHFSLEDHFKA